jgi:hypothetical protein
LACARSAGRFHHTPPSRICPSGIYRNFPLTFALLFVQHDFAFSGGGTWLSSISIAPIRKA